MVNKLGRSRLSPHVGPKGTDHPFTKFKLQGNDENIGNHGYIGNLILRIYWIYWRNIDGYFGKKILIGKKLIKTHKNVKKKKLHNNIIRSIIDNLNLFY